MDYLELRAVEGADTGMRVALGEGGFVGRSAACKFRLSDPSVQPMHARIRQAGDRYVLTDVSEGVGLQVNDLPAKSRPLQAGDRIRVGAVVLEIVPVAPPADVAADAPAPQSAAAPAPQKGVAGKPVAGRVRIKGRAPPPAAPAGGGATPAPVAERPETAGQPETQTSASGTPVWIVSGVIALIAVAVVAGLWIHLISLRKEVEMRYREVAELAKAGRVTSSQALDRYRGVLSEAEQVHPRMAERLKAMIRSIEADVLAGQERLRAALRDLDAKADELAARGEYAQAADVYKTADSSLQKTVEDSRAPRIVELERLAVEKATKQGKTE